jgi:cell division septum initiation protein DivIVA
MKHLATHKKKVGIGTFAEEATLLEQEGDDGTAAVDFEVSPEPTMDELIADVEDVVEQFNSSIKALTNRLDGLEKTVMGKTEAKGNVAEAFLKNPKTMISAEDAIKMIQNVLPSPMVERSWGFGPQRLCQELRGVVIKLRERVKRNGQPR